MSGETRGKLQSHFQRGAEGNGGIKGLTMNYYMDDNTNLDPSSIIIQRALLPFSALVTQEQNVSLHRVRPVPAKRSLAKVIVQPKTVESNINTIPTKIMAIKSYAPFGTGIDNSETLVNDNSDDSNISEYVITQQLQSGS